MIEQSQLPKFAVHNRTGAAQWSVQPAFFGGRRFERQGTTVKVVEKGYLMIEVANAKGKPQNNGPPEYDWSNKVSMKLTDVDIQKILGGLRGAECKIVHDPNKANGVNGKQVGSLMMQKGERYGFFLFLSRGDRKVKCPISDDEAATLRLLLTKAITRIYGW